MKNVEKVSSTLECLYNVSLDNEHSLNRSSKLDKIDILIDLRKKEEDFLISLYKENTNFSKVYEQYLLTMHAYFLTIAIENPDNLKSKIQKYAKDTFLKEKIKQTFPKRFDYKLFKILYLKERSSLLYVYFKIKKILTKVL